MPVYDWEVSEEADGKVVAKLCGTEVHVLPSTGEAGGWRWEVHFADGQTQSGTGEDPDAALEKGKRVAERFLP